MKNTDIDKWYYRKIFVIAVHAVSLIFTVIKLLGLIPTWPWWLVLSPLIADAGVLVIIFLMMISLVMLG